MNEFNAYLGQPLEVLIQALERAGKTIRIISNNGYPMVVSQEINVNRLNVIVENDIVTLIGNFG